MDNCYALENSLPCGTHTVSTTKLEWSMLNIITTRCYLLSCKYTVLHITHLIETKLYARSQKHRSGNTYLYCGSSHVFVHQPFGLSTKASSTIDIMSHDTFGNNLITTPSIYTRRPYNEMFK